MLRISHASVFVADQEEALKFYTEVLGFAEKHNLPLGANKWITVTTADDPNGTELVLEPNENPIIKEYQMQLFEQGIPAMMFTVDDVQTEYERLKGLGVNFSVVPTEMGNVTFAVFEDTCGNLIQVLSQ